MNGAQSTIECSRKPSKVTAARCPNEKPVAYCHRLRLLWTVQDRNSSETHGFPNPSSTGNQQVPRPPPRSSPVRYQK
jgi:hypothetical protein